MDYVASAITYVDDDVELPLPAPEFAACVRSLTAPGTRTQPV